MSDAAELVEEMAERLAQPEPPKFKYISVAPPTNHAIRRAAILRERRRRRQFHRWFLRMIRLGFNPEDILVERRRKAEEQRKKEMPHVS